MRYKIFVCEKCGEEGEYEHDRKASVFEVLIEIKDQHYQADRFCIWDNEMVRVTIEREKLGE